MTEKVSEKIKEHWNERARQYSGTSAATTNDVYLRELEISTIIQTLHEIALPENGSVLDIGCGDGYSTLKVAQQMEGRYFLGVDYSERMIETARKRREAQPDSAASLKERVAFTIGDATALEQVCGESVYDVVLTDRCLINLGSFERQSQVIVEIAKRLKPRGYYIAIENFLEGQENMNQARRSVGLPAIPVRWHNLFFKEEDFARSTERFFEVPCFKDFSSSYYFATRVVYSAACKVRGEEPDYHHEIHQIAIHLPWFGQFSPIRMVVLRKKPRESIS